MRGYCHDRNFVATRTVRPENAKRRRAAVLRVGFVNSLLIRSGELRIGMRMQARMTRIPLQASEGMHCPETLGRRRIAQTVGEVRLGLISEPKAEGRPALITRLRRPHTCRTAQVLSSSLAASLRPRPTFARAWRASCIATPRIAARRRRRQQSCPTSLTWTEKRNPSVF